MASRSWFCLQPVSDSQIQSSLEVEDRNRCPIVGSDQLHLISSTVEPMSNTIEEKVVDLMRLDESMADLES
jgi:hypothetical protein